MLAKISTNTRNLKARYNRLYEVRGYSAYEVAVIDGYKGTEEEWLASLKGDPGAGLSTEAVSLLLTILSEAVYISDQSGNIQKLKEALQAVEDEPDEPVVTQTVVTAALGIARLGCMRLGIPYQA